MNYERRRLLPPTGMLAVFSAAARLENFSRAADELGLTQSAVSRQINNLEDWLQLKLFVREGRGVRLTLEGRGYAAAIRPALDRIRTATDLAVRKAEGRELSIATLPSFGMRWLAPRLPALTATHPNLVVNFEARSFQFDFAEEKFHAAIHFGFPNWPDARHDMLFRETTIPVCAPSRLVEHPIRRPEDILEWPMLVQTSRREAWRRWFDAAGVDALIPSPSGSFEQFLMLAQAAAAGAGIALIPRFLIEPELKSGALISPVDLVLEGEEAYYFVTPLERPSSDAIEAFRLWIIKEASIDNN